LQGGFGKRTSGIDPANTSSATVTGILSKSHFINGMEYLNNGMGSSLSKKNTSKLGFAGTIKNNSVTTPEKGMIRLPNVMES
jgi:hypothetical protein